MSFIRGNGVWRIPEFLKIKKKEKPEAPKPIPPVNDEFCWRCKSYHPKDQECLMAR